FCAPPVSRDKARDMLRRTRAWRLIEGYRGSAPRDVEAVIDALVGLGRLAVGLPGVIESVDINPFVALPKGTIPGGMALDALVVVCRELRTAAQRGARASSSAFSRTSSRPSAMPLMVRGTGWVGLMPTPWWREPSCLSTRMPVHTSV